MTNTPAEDFENNAKPQSQLARWIQNNPGKTTGLVTINGDALMLASGLAYGNIGRILGGAFGAISNIPLITHGDSPEQDDKSSEHIDNQDFSFFNRVKNYWKFWEYPYEFNASLKYKIQSTYFFPLSF